MGDLYNTQTRKPESLPEDQINSAILAGTHAYPVGTRVNVVDQDGNAQSVASEELKDALGQGFKLETPSQAAVRKYAEENSGVAGAAKAFAAQALDETAMGIPGIIFRKTADPLEVAKFEALKKEHNFASDLGSVTGFGASLFAGGPIFKGAAKAGEAAAKVVAERLAAAGVERGSSSMAKRIVAKVAESATKMGVEGAGIAAPRAITEGMLGDPDQAAETLLYGAGIGGALGVGGLVLEPAVGKVIEKYKSSAEDSGSAIEDFQNSRAAKALGFTKGQLKKLKGGEDEAKQVAGRLLEAKTADGKPIISALSSADDMLDQVERFKEEAGNRVGAVFQKLDDAGMSSFNPLEVASRIDSEIGPEWRSPLNRGETGQLDNTLEAILMRGDKPISFAEAQTLKGELQTAAYPKGYWGPSTPKMEMARSALGILNDELEKSVAAAEKQIKEGLVEVPPELKSQEFMSELKNSKLDYAAATKAERALNDHLTSQYGNKTFGLTDVIAGTGAGAEGGPLAGALVVGAKKVAEKYGNQILATMPVDGLLAAEQAMKRVAKKLDEIPDALDRMIRGGTTAVKGDILGALGRLAEGSSSRHEAFNAVSQKISDPMSDPMGMSSRVASITTPFQKTGAPTVADAFNSKMTQAVQYLHRELPRPSSPPNPLVREKFKPSDAQLSAFERKLRTVMDPFTVIEDLKHGAVTRDQIDTLKAVYPKLYEQMQRRIIDHISQNEKTYPYQARLKLSMFMGFPLDSSLTPRSIRMQQEAYSQESAAGGQRSPASPLPRASAKLSIAERTALK